MRKTASLLMLMLFVSVLSIKFQLAISQEEGAMAQVDPPYVICGEEGLPLPSAFITVTINVTNVQGMLDWQIKLYFNQSVIDTCPEHIDLPVDHIFAGRPFASPTPVVGTDENGKYVLFCAGIFGEEGVTGSGKLFRINFTAVAAGTSYLNFSRPLGEGGYTWYARYNANKEYFLEFLPFDDVTEGIVIVRGETGYKEPSIITISANKQSLYLCDNLTLKGNVTKVDGAQKTAAEVIIYICFPDELDFHFFANTVTDEEGQFDYVWTPTPFYEAGSYKLRALWHGDETTYGNKSETIDIILQSITIFIRADGSVDPSDAPIQRNGDRYTLTRNVGTNTDAIVIEKDNIVLDGAGHRLQGYGTGIHLLGRTNVTIRNLEIRSFGINQYFYISFDCGMNLFNSSHNTICGNNFLHEEFFAKGGKAIQLVSSSNNTICRNTITNEYKAIILVESSNQNTISENTMTNNTYSVLVGESLSNIIARNYMTNNTYGITTKNAANSNIEENTINNGQTGIKINYSDNNVISGNELIDNTVGIGIFDSDFNAIFENEILKNELGINFGCASGNRIYHNNFINNTEQIGVSDSILDDGYPSGGNYWSDYNGTDKYSGPYQNVSGNDGIGDMPYFIDIIHMDNYPLIKPWPRRATVDIQPHTINLQNGKVPITTYIELLKGSNLTQINIFSILLNNTLPANTLIPLTYGDYDSDTIPDLMINFNKTKVSDFILSRGITTGTITLTITGQLYDGASFVRSVIIKVRMAGDVSIDGKVDGKDLAVIAKAFGSNPTRPNWNPVADENEDGKIDGKDIVYIAKNFGRIYA